LEAELIRGDALPAHSGNKNKEGFAMASAREVLKKECNPHSIDGQELIIHELAHIVQQRQGRFSRSSGKGIASDVPNDVHEQEAGREAKKITSP